MIELRVLLMVAACVLAATSLAVHSPPDLIQAPAKCSRARVVKSLPGFVSYCDVDDITVTYDGTSVLINDERTVFLSGSVHGPRATPSVWRSVLDKAVDFGLNMVEVYVMWNYHEPIRGEQNFTMLGALLDECAAYGLFVTLRVGPYVCAEWDYGGMPVWVGLDNPTIQFRTSDPAWLAAMQNWTTAVVEYSYPWFAGRGGPIVLAQIENELEGDPDYVQWCGDLANSLEDSVPWIMCNGDSANNTINTCNGNDCVPFLETNGQNGRVLIDQPAMWTENEMGYQVWGESQTAPSDYFWGVPASQTAFDTLRWFARGGTHNNYYMYFGGSNFGSFAAAGITQAYAYDAPLCPNGAKHQPKFDHLKGMHEALRVVASRLFQPYKNVTIEGGSCLMYGDVSFVQADDQPLVHRNVTVPPNSISLFDNDQLLFNSHTLHVASYYARRDQTVVASLEWQHRLENLNDGSSVQGLIEQSELTRNEPSTQYAVYSTTIDTNGTLLVESDHANGFVAFVDGAYQSSADNHLHADGPLNYTLTVAKKGALVLLSESFGFSNLIGRWTQSNGPKKKGIVGRVFLNGDELLPDTWTSRPGLVGFDGGTDGATATSPATWSQAVFATPTMTTNRNSGLGVLLDATGLGRGHFFVNGIDAGRFWNITRDGTTTPSQRFYHIPPDWLKDDGTNNTLLVFDALGSPDISQVRIITTTIQRADSPNMPDVIDANTSCLIG